MILGSISIKSGSIEKRTVLSPETIKKLAAQNIKILINKGYGSQSNISDNELVSLGAEIADEQKIYQVSDILAKINLEESEKIDLIKTGSILILNYFDKNNKEMFDSLLKKNINIFSLDSLPRITRAQSMDILSSQANLAGYRAVIDSVYEFNRAVPMMMTAAGTVTPAKFFVIGAGVAGLQAIATAKRLGARVEAFDTRDVVEEQVKSLGAKFVKIDLGDTGQTDQGYAKELTPEQIAKQKDLQSQVCERSDIVITTAQIFGRPAPKIIDESTIKKMKPGSVILDMAVETGGNVEGSIVDEVVSINGVKVVGVSYLASRVSSHASFALSNNIINWVADFYNEETAQIDFDFEDEVIQSSVLAYEGKIMNERFA